MQDVKQLKSNPATAGQNPKLKTLNPKPETPNPKPETLILQSWNLAILKL
jgi:hypothetical protein